MVFYKMGVECASTPFLWLLIRYIATNHLISGNLVSLTACHSKGKQRLAVLQQYVKT